MKAWPIGSFVKSEPGYFGSPFRGQVVSHPGPYSVHLDTNIICSASMVVPDPEGGSLKVPEPRKKAAGGSGGAQLSLF